MGVAYCMTKAAAIYQFWSGFGLTAYEENTVPEDAAFPYVTYQLVTDSFDREVAATASLWYRSTSWTEINAKTDEISERLGLGGVVLPCDNGAVWVKPGQPFAQNMSDPADEMIRRKYINISAEYITRF